MIDDDYLLMLIVIDQIKNVSKCIAQHPILLGGYLLGNRIK